MRNSVAIFLQIFPCVVIRQRANAVGIAVTPVMLGVFRIPGCRHGLCFCGENMNLESPIPNWQVIFAGLPPEPPDDYHFTLRRGDTRYGLDWLAPEDKRAPATRDCAWSVLNAWYSFSNGQHWNGYAAETLILAHSRIVGRVAVDVLKKHHGRDTNEFRFDTGGADLYAEGLSGSLEALKTLEFAHEDFAPDKPDILDQIAKYVARAAKNQMLDYLDAMFPRQWRNAKHLDGLDGGQSEEWMEHFGRHRAERVIAAIKAACDKPWLWEAVCERWARDRTQAELAVKFNVTRDEIQKSLRLVLRRVEAELELNEAEIKQRARRRRS